MSLVVPNVSELEQLDVIVIELLATAEFRLFKNNYTPIATSVTGDFTEADYSGYGGEVVSSWTSVDLDLSGRAFTLSDVIPYAHDGGGTANTIYGYYVTTPGGTLLFAERFGTPVVMDDATDGFSIQTTYRLREGV